MIVDEYTLAPTYPIMFEGPPLGGEVCTVYTGDSQRQKPAVVGLTGDGARDPEGAANDGCLKVLVDKRSPILIQE